MRNNKSGKVNCRATNVEQQHANGNKVKKRGKLLSGDEVGTDAIINIFQ